METVPKYHVSLFWRKPGDKLMYRIISETEVYLVQVKGRDLKKPFTHRHEKVTFPSLSRLLEDLDHMEASDIKAWEELMSEYLAVNDEKRKDWSDYRQSFNPLPVVANQPTFPFQVKSQNPPA